MITKVTQRCKTCALETFNNEENDGSRKETNVNRTPYLKCKRSSSDNIAIRKIAHSTTHLLKDNELKLTSPTELLRSFSIWASLTSAIGGEYCAEVKRFAEPKNIPAKLKRRDLGVSLQSKRNEELTHTGGDESENDRRRPLNESFDSVDVVRL
ncbi:hypothetical protein Tcan_01557, partial [Toxocara canis]